MSANPAIAENLTKAFERFFAGGFEDRITRALPANLRCEFVHRLSVLKCDVTHVGIDVFIAKNKVPGWHYRCDCGEHWSPNGGDYGWEKCTQCERLVEPTLPPDDVNMLQAG